MSNKLKEKLLIQFTGKMENEQAFVIQYMMKEAQKGIKPPSKDEIDKCIQQMVDEGIFERKDSLLILKASKAASPVPEMEEMDENEEEIPVISTSSIKGDFTENQKKILAAFQGKFENKSAILMNATMAEISQGKKPPDKEILEKSIEELLDKGTLELKGQLLIKKM